MNDERTYIKIGDVEKGMSLRDYFAAKALPAVIEACRHDTRKLGQSHENYFALKAYKMADAMLEVRDETTS